MKILGHVVRVISMPEQFDDNVMGYCNIKQNAIYIDAKLSAKAREAVKLHEAIHYVSDTLGLELTEEQVSGVSTGLFSAGVRIK